MKANTLARTPRLVLIGLAYLFLCGQNAEYVVSAELHPSEVDALFAHLASEGLDGLWTEQRAHVVENLEDGSATTFAADIGRENTFRTIRVRARKSDDETIQLYFLIQSETFASHFQEIVDRYFGDDNIRIPPPLTT